MTSIRLAIHAAAFAVLSAAPAMAAPAYVVSTANLRSGAGTNHEIVAKIPAGSLADASNCAEGWCEVEWQGKKGFTIATALDMSGRVPSRSAAPRTVRPRGPESDYVLVDPPGYYEAPVYYYPYRPYYRPYYSGYGYGYRPWRRW
jgi:uncharacterized protein YraI